MFLWTLIGSFLDARTNRVEGRMASASRDNRSCPTRLLSGWEGLPCANAPPGPKYQCSTRAAVSTVRVSRVL